MSTLETIVDVVLVPLRVWGQEEATMNEQICGFLTQTDMEDAEKHGATQSIVQVDLVGCEHTEFSLDQKFLQNQPQTTIGNKQIARLQVTDNRFAKCGKAKQQRPIAAAHVDERDLLRR